MRQVTVHNAKTNLSKLIDAALAGEEIIIAKGDKPVVKLVALPQSAFRIGMLAGQLDEVPDFLDVMDEHDLSLWEGGA